MKHGTRSAYNAHGCRCDDCREANNAYARKRMHTGQINRAAKAVICERLNTLVATLVSQEIFSEGQLSKILDVHRVGVREMVDDGLRALGDGPIILPDPDLEKLERVELVGKTGRTV